MWWSGKRGCGGGVSPGFIESQRRYRRKAHGGKDFRLCLPLGTFPALKRRGDGRERKGRAKARVAGAVLACVQRGRWIG